MPKYKMVMLRFNMEKDEAEIYNNLNPNNKAGHIKSILNSVLVGKGIEYTKKAYIEEIINDILSNKELIMDIRGREDNKDNKNIDEDFILNSASSIMKGAI